MITLSRTNAKDSEFVNLVKKLDSQLAIYDGDEHAFFDQYNKLDHIKYVVIAKIKDVPVGCGAIKEYEEQTMEIKRMFTDNAYRGKGVASSILAELELWSKELGYGRCILETGVNQKGAIGLYRKNEYRRIPNYGQYQNVESSRCFEKVLDKKA